MKKNIYTKIFFFIIIATFIVFAPNSFAKEELQIIENVPLEKSKILLDRILFKDKVLLASTEFDLREHIDIRVKDQKSTQQCWAFAITTSLETNLAITKNEIADFSERHIIYSTARHFNDGENPMGHNRTVGGGGNSTIAMAYYTSGRGPILEEDMPFVESELPINLSEIEGKEVQKKITDYVIFPSIIKSKSNNGDVVYTNEDKSVTYTENEVNQARNNIKEHIRNYGSVTTMTVYGSAYNEYYNFNLDYPAFYCDNEDLELNHQVSIIGWDDDYPIENFNEEHRPSKPGAYLILNSYGEKDNFPEGCYYISYEDRYVELGVIGIINAEDIDYENIYQHDPLGLSSSIHIDGLQTIYGANVFEKHKDIMEELNEISIADMVEQNVEIYVNSKDGDLSPEKLEKIEVEQLKIRPGYTTIKFKDPVKLTGGKFVVAVKYTGNGKDGYIGVESASKEYWNTATSNLGESFYSDDMENWVDLAETEIKNTNICIKAFTKEIGYNVTSDTYKVEEEIIYRIPLGTTVEELKNNLGLILDTKLFRDNEELEQDDIISTGTELLVDNSKTYKLVVTGDVTGTGDVTVTDISNVKLHFIGLELLNELKQKAADTNGDEEITITDVSQIKLHFIGLEPINK